MVDVGFGGPGPTQPLPLVDGLVSKWGATNAESRLTHKGSASSFVQGLWTYEHRISKSHDWKPVYCFGMTEFSRNDFEVMNFAISSQRTSWFTYKIICMKMLLHDQSKEIVGILALTDKTLKKRVQEDSETLAECSSEEKRIELLEKHFGVVLSQKDRDGIRGTMSELNEDS
jgi:arylamine N-acetyltransferase